MVLDTGWLLRGEDLTWGIDMAPIVLSKTEGWLATELPCDVHMPLIEHNRMKEPLEADNFADGNWIESKSWWFLKQFEITEESLKTPCIELSMESLDVEADIFINGIWLGHHRSAFYPFHANVRKTLRAGQNKLLVRLTTGVEYYPDTNVTANTKVSDTSQEASKKANIEVDTRGEKRRIYLRKPQYVFGTGALAWQHVVSPGV
jgi:beta-mannosidase